MTQIYDFVVQNADGCDVPLSDFRDKVLLIVNVASKCGKTIQYEGLQKIYKKYKNKGLEIIAFPCNQFGGQEPGTMDEILEFCSLEYGVEFPIMEKIDVNGRGAHPLYQYLSDVMPAEDGRGRIRWNFTKFLIDSEGVVAKRYDPNVLPKDIESDIIELL